MPKRKPVVVVTRRLPEVIETRMRELFDARLNETDKPPTHEELAEAMRTADVLVPTITDRIDAGLIAQAGEQMKLIANFGNGVDNIDVASALRRSITVTNTPGVLTEDTADMTMALILAVARRIVEGANVIGSGLLERLGADLDARPPHHRQAARHRRHGPDRPGAGPARQRVRPVDPLPQPPPAAGGDRRAARGDLLGKPRPDAGARGHSLDPLPPHAGDLPSAFGAASETVCGRTPSW